MSDAQKQIKELRQALLKAGQDIEALSKVKSDFVSIISHELRTPLTAIKESVSLVLDGVAGPINVEQKNFLIMAKKNIDRLVNVITNILDFSRLESGRVTMHKRKMNMNEIIKESYELMKESAAKENIRFEMDLAEDICMTWFDPDRIRQVFKNLISNAIKFNKPDGCISLSSSNAFINGKNVIKIGIEDTGIGIPEDQSANLFNMFNPLDSGMTRSYSGVGMGLAVCRRIIDCHSGDIRAESKKDIGTKITFTLPVYKKDDEFNFLLDDSITKAGYNDSNLALIFFGVKIKKDANEEKMAGIEKIVRSTVRGPEDRVVRFRQGSVVAVMAGTDREGTKKILKRLKEKIKIPLKYGLAVYPENTNNKMGLIEKAEENLKSGEFMV
ncbi:MAG: HAMP domain-containing histidine kinase [Candidatus Omnitrophica bacterium]|nr:HAMP domain-containing histidine kinase [Candidatus Omnitrophota bacterium]